MKLYTMFAAAQAYYTTTEDSTSTTTPWTTNTQTTLDAHPDQFTDCGGAISSAGTFSSPNFPSFYPRRARCTWEIDIGRAPGFYLVPNYFAIEPIFNDHNVSGSQCGHDFLKVVENGVERNFCGFNENSSQEYHIEYDGGKWTPDLPNESKEGFPKMFVLGGKA